MTDCLLIVDDSPSMLMGVSIALHPTGLDIEEADSAEKALQVIDAGLKPRMILTDLNMGGMSGIDLVKAVRKLPGMGFTPVVLLTTESQDDMRQMANAAGATGWLVKPFDPDKLVALVKKLVP
ncbi:two-component system chemotaxis response regulator CheY [Sphingomonas jinjuensis]|uniref:Two-component system chemotaxis response regulator CheY n=1 Tax=Sphingomonas jinjuensis TaxID=535907 RepID=A0A840FIF5_9SPHN|nr:response regulator [Sphingomonas jinjuensis]MBB4153738.1 two-component system chemotaxis response regulator CheY [Sphingomonas jinjuensis]